jgi:hypothetical protein
LEPQRWIQGLLLLSVALPPSGQSVLPETVIIIWMSKMAEGHLLLFMVGIQILGLGLVIILLGQGSQLSWRLWHLLMELDRALPLERNILPVLFILLFDQIIFDDVWIDVPTAG